MQDSLTERKFHGQGSCKENKNPGCTPPHSFRFYFIFNCVYMCVFGIDI